MQETVTIRTTNGVAEKYVRIIRKNIEKQEKLLTGIEGYIARNNFDKLLICSPERFFLNVDAVGASRSESRTRDNLKRMRRVMELFLVDGVEAITIDAGDFLLSIDED